jgi:hypothetical protein
VKNGIGLLSIFDVFVKFRTILKPFLILKFEYICFNLQAQLSKMLYTRVLSELQRCQKIDYLHRSPHAAPYHSSCCTSCDWSGQPFYSDTDCTSWHTSIESGNLLLIKLFPFLSLNSILFWKLIINTLRTGYFNYLNALFPGIKAL